ncbi:carboxymuconolactone decarboxylase family protein [Roseococcus sp. DSY-14]|uniref:carboxymuconolactone decarboxylase family protein n=1 Tax=Roseococcus sp. DSY-14 TaxID=3369650 RepID=UPI00387AF5CC
MRFDDGLAVLREVLGEDYARRAEAGRAHPFAAPFTEIATEAAWGGAWARDDLDRRTRSLVTLGMLLAIGAPGEVKLHTRGALRNGATREEVRAVVLHAVAYCGVPRALEGLRAVMAALKELDGAD